MTEQKRKDCEQCGEGLACVICGADVYEPLKVGPENTPHLKYETSERGFLSLPAIPSSYGGQVRVYESSAAEHPHIWLNAEAPKDLNRPEGEQVEAPMHLTVENAKALAEQLLFLVDEHYQGEWDDEDECYESACGCDSE